jgi:predicted small secreted protein
MVRSVVLALALGRLALTAACNTVKGAGKDITSVGEGGDKVINPSPSPSAT